MGDRLNTGTILVIDDRPEQARALLGALGNTVEIVHPSMVSLSELESAKVVLVDHDLKDADWPERKSYPLACQPLDGMALGHLLLGHFRAPEFKHFPPTAIGLLSADLEIITPGFEDVPEHIAARASGLHWAFWKEQKPIDPEEPLLTDRITIYAKAVMALPKSWANGSDQDHLYRLLGLDGSDIEEWKHLGVNQALRCSPPLHELATWTSGLAFVRWLSQRILPYPTFLCSLDVLAVHLGVEPAWFRRHMSVGMPLEIVFRSAEYRGILSGFAGRRWWFAGIDSILQKAGPDVPFSRSAQSKWLNEAANDLPNVLCNDCTLVVNERTIFSGQTAQYDNCVRLQLDDWPSFASEPWATIELVKKEDRLRASVNSDYEGRLSDD